MTTTQTAALPPTPPLGIVTALAEFDWCIACDERPAHDNSLLCWDCDESLPFDNDELTSMMGAQDTAGVALAALEVLTGGPAKLAG
jgi:hypothetical protein